MDVKEQIALSILKGAGGDVDKDYTSTAEIYRDVESIYRSQDNRQDVDPLQVELIDNGTYTYDDRNTQGYKPVEITVNVPVEDYYNSGFENGIVIQKAKLEAITITENGIYNKEDGYDEVEVNIDTQSYYDNGYNNGYNDGDNNGYERGYGEGDNNGYERGYGEGVDNGIQEQKSKLESITIEANGTYIKEDGYNEVKVALDIPKTKIYNGFRFVSEGNNDYKRIKDIDFSLYDWRGVYSMKDFFGGFKSTDGSGLVASDFDNFIEHFNGSFTSCGYMFQNSNALLEAPNFGDRTENCIDMTRMFYGCSNLTTIPHLNTSNVIYTNNMFEGCTKLTSIPLLDTSNGIDMQYMFHNCYKLTSIPQLDTSNVTDMKYMFYGCSNLTSIPQLDTSSVTDMEYMFYRCSNLTSIPQLDTSNVTDMKYMFYGCSNLTSIPQLDTSSVTDMDNMFAECTSLITIPQLDTSKTYRVSYTFAGCNSLQSIPLLDFGNINAISLFGWGRVNSLTDLGGFKDLGKQSGINGINGGFLDFAPNLTHESLMNVINNLYDRKSSGMSTMTIKFGTDHINKLSDEEKAIAINKGWTLS